MTLAAKRIARLSAVPALVLLLAACGGGSKSASPARDANGCIPVKSPAPNRRREAPPTAALVASKTYDVTFHTNCGSFTIRLANKTSPKTSASFVSLARKGFFDVTIFHRIVPGFVIQGGDPTATGAGGPGYTTVEPPPASTRYTLGVAAMAKAPNDPGGAAGSQFFIITAPDAQLPPDYALLGKVVRGLAVVKSIGKLGDASSGNAGTPTETVEIQKATVHVS